MGELDKALSVAVKGPVAEKALAEHRRQMEIWGIVMPEVTPVVLDFGLGMFDRVGEIEHWIVNETERGYCGKFLFVHDGQTCPTHHHRVKHETFYVVKGAVRMTCDGRDHEIHAGDVLIVANNTSHAFTGIGPALLLEVSTAGLVDDNYFENEDIPIGGNYKKSREGDDRFHVVDGQGESHRPKRNVKSPRRESR